MTTRTRKQTTVGTDSQAFSDYDFVIPGGESINQLIARFMRGLDLVCETGCFKTAAVISHGAAISNIRSYLLGKRYEDVDFCVLVGSRRNYKVVASGRYADVFGSGAD